MPDWPLLFNSALMYGLALSVVLTAIMIASGAIAADMWIGDYPPDIKERYGPMSPRGARVRPYIAVLFFVAVLVIVLLGLLTLRARVDDVPFLPAVAFSVAALLVFNTYDLIVLDWLFFCTIQPRMMVLPGTEGMAGYRDYRFHFIGFLKGLGFCVVGAIIISGLWMVLQRVTA
ncbi:MAG: hypothetical protein A2Z17_00210 [Gammaproteobacteria bacterium RBG_16_66_13]|nr:MAG: hypothetical protein A2Z17_00210 [Gammaproteobacteria bacterium RBG_16_66_13]